MKKIFLNRTNILLFLFLSSVLYSQSYRTKTVTDTIKVNLNNSYKISSLTIIPSSEKIILKRKTLSTHDYSFNFSTGSFSLSQNLNYSLLDTLFVTYETVILKLNREYKRRSLVFQYDDKILDTIRASKRVTEPLTVESIFGKDLQKSGSIVRGFTIGTNRDFTLNSGLRLQLSGKLSDDIDIVAALTDENTPIQPEGNTEKLEELDKVFIELKHPNAVGTFGDYELNLRGNEFSSITRKLQGLKGDFTYGATKGTIAIAGSRGKFNTNQFNGLDGNQGPYRLTGINNERAIIIIAGSERIYLNGEELKRGENKDYIIDYSNAEITFTPKRLITSVSRISVDFEYTDQSFRRNFFGADFSTKLFDDKFKIGIGYLSEGDDENSPIEYSFTDSELAILRSAGSDRNAAVKSGISLALPDSTGKIQGVYTRIDTLINSQQFTYYKYLPGAVTSIYNVSFSYTGSGNGDYTKESLGKYRFVGLKNGSYLPLIYLPMPELKQLGNISIAANILEGIDISAELSGSMWDKNKLSTIDDENNFGYARSLLLEMKQREIKISNSSLGKIGFTLKDRFVDGRFSSLDRINEVEFNRGYNLPLLIAADQTLRELSLNYSPVQNSYWNTKYGYLKQGDNFSSNRIFSQIKFGDANNYQIESALDYVSSINIAINSDWIRNNGKAFYTVGSFKPGFEYLYEDKTEKSFNSVLLLPTSLKIIEVVPYIEFNLSPSFDAKASFSLRDESIPLNGMMTNQYSAIIQQLQLNFRGVKEISTSLTMSLRNKKYSEEFRKKGFGDNETVLLLSQSRFNFWNGFITGDLYYQAATEQSSLMEKVFLKVPKGSGNYIYLGDLNYNGISEENEFQITAYEGDFILLTVPTEKLYPVIALKSNTRWRIDFNKIITGEDFWVNLLKPISTETSFRIEENSKDPKTINIYMLRLSKFLNDSTTINGSQLFQQDVNLFQNSNELSFRFRITERKSLNQFSGGTENGYFRERGLRIKFRMMEEISNQSEYINQVDNLISPVTSNRARLVTRNNISTDFSYRPQREIEIGLKIEAGRSEDFHRISPSVIDLNSISFRANISFENLGRLRIEAERIELISSSNSANLPFEMTRGNAIGKNYFWRIYFDYRVSSFVQTSFSYDARVQGASRVIQTMRAEARAYF